MILGYPRQPSPRAGGELRLHVSTDAPLFRVEFYRCTDRLVPHGGSDWLPGTCAPLHLPFQDWGEDGTGLHGEHLPAWPAHTFPVPASWPPGVYVAVLVEGDDAGRDRSSPDRTGVDARDARALFVVRPAPGARTAPLLYKLPLLTYHAYDLVDGQEYDPATGRGHWCFYNLPESGQVPVPVPPTVNLHRPGGGTGGTPYDIVINPDPYDPSPRQTFVHWDGPFLAWLHRQGYDVDVCTDADLHREGAALLAPYRLLISAGHDEYWSDAMRAGVEAHVARGGSVAFFGGNTCWWRVVFDDDVAFARVHNWSDDACPGEPENTLIGVSFRNGGERDRDDHPVPVGYRVQHADHWVYEGTGLRDGDTFGVAENLVGYECDGAAFDRADLEADRPVAPTGEDATPAGFTILAVGDTRPSGWDIGNGAATMGLHTPGGTVFNAATTDWVRGLRTCPPVERITRNVLDRLGGVPARDLHRP